MAGLLISDGVEVPLSAQQEWLLTANGQISRQPGEPARVVDDQVHGVLAILEATAEGLRCQFCAALNPAWRYPILHADVGDHTLGLLLEHRGGWLGNTGWLACDDCARLIARTDRDALARHSTNAHFKKPGTSCDPRVRRRVEANMRAAQDAFWRSRQGPREPVPSF